MNNTPRKRECLNERDSQNLSQQIGSTKDEEKRGRVKNTIRYGYQCINTSGGGAAKSIVALQKSGQIIE